MSFWWGEGAERLRVTFIHTGLNFSTETRLPTYPGKQSHGSGMETARLVSI